VPPDAFLLLNAFDALSVPERKNPLGLIDAFGRACRQSDRRLHLLLKVSHSDSHPTLMAELTRAAADLPVTIVARHLSRRDVNGLLSAADAYLALHRSEGLGLPLIEAMYLGKPVIATGYGGVTDFLNDETGWVVRYGMTELEQAHGPYPQGAVWAAPDTDHAASLICRVSSEPEEVARRVTRATDAVRELYLPEAFAHRLERELARIHDGP
jgi:glycosyltransferase involved in cell wall biosynthesis